ncbi:tripartite motif-containing protein 16-like [Archocentrus centrarchus]|uniref:tripartite motif-containing protein 16-like n=1 Tax=Archocentrus centrarchus TaxID=63155 RepID=UPI0011E9CBB9|nr:tripartite motif-containing protein 16-like [Archocentrus centrarchus]
MALQASRLDEKKLCCSICLDLLKDPATLPCGHNYCMKCIKRHWDGEDQKHIHSCPQCRQTFIPRPALKKNTMLAGLVEEMKTELRIAPADHCYAGPGDVACDVCSERKLKAIKSCLQCLVSYCEQHLQPHYDVAAFEKHKLVDTSKSFKKIICSCHNEVVKIFCRTDQQCICILCSMDEHRGHDTVSAAAERKEKQRELGVSRKKIQQRIQDREKDLKVLQQEMKAIAQSADKAVKDSEKIFSEVKQQIRSHQKSEVTRTRELQERIENEITELRRQEAELEQLSHTQDHTHFLQTYTSLPQVNESAGSPNIKNHAVQYFKDVMTAVSEFKTKLQEIHFVEGTTVSQSEAEVCRAEPKTRAEFLRLSRELTLDSNTANTSLLFEGDKKVKCLSKKMLYCHHADRFANRHQVLSRESLTGRCYWEVLWSGGALSVAVSYKTISRTGDESLFGNNDRSWALECYKSGYELRHNKIRTPVSGPHSSRIGIYLDHRAGVLSFYSISKTMTLLHRVQTSFTQPLCAGFWLYVGSCVELCELKLSGNRVPF